MYSLKLKSLVPLSKWDHSTSNPTGAINGTMKGTKGPKGKLFTIKRKELWRSSIYILETKSQLNDDLGDFIEAIQNITSSLKMISCMVCLKQYVATK